MKVGYVRVSKHEQHETLQVDALQKAGCEEIFTDKGVSGAKVERVELNKALAFLRRGDTLVVWKLDRAGRSLRHLIDFLNELQTRGIEFESVTERIDTSTPMGKLLFHLTAAIAEFERDLIRERTNAGLEAARARGRHGGRKPKIRNVNKLNYIRQLYAEKTMPVYEICDTYGISKPTLYRIVREGQQNVSENI